MSNQENSQQPAGNMTPSRKRKLDALLKQMESIDTDADKRLEQANLVSHSIIEEKDTKGKESTSKSTDKNKNDAPADQMDLLIYERGV